MASWVESANAGFDFGTKVGGALAQRKFARLEEEVRNRYNSGEFGDPNAPETAAGALEKAQAELRRLQGSTRTLRAHGTGKADAAAGALQQDFTRRMSGRAATHAAAGRTRETADTLATLGAGSADVKLADSSALMRRRIDNTRGAGNDRIKLAESERDIARDYGDATGVSAQTVAIRDQYLSQLQQVIPNMDKYPEGYAPALIQKMLAYIPGMEKAQVSVMPDGKGVFVDPDGPGGNSGWPISYADAADVNKVQKLLMSLGGNPDDLNERMRGAQTAADTAAATEAQRQKAEYQKRAADLLAEVNKQSPQLAPIFGQVVTAFGAATQGGWRPAGENAAGEQMFSFGGNVYTVKSDPATGATGLIDQNGKPPPQSASLESMLATVEGMRQMQRANDYNFGKAKFATFMADLASIYGQASPTGGAGGALGGAGSQPGTALPQRTPEMYRGRGPTAPEEGVSAQPAAQRGGQTNGFLAGAADFGAKVADYGMALPRVLGNAANAQLTMLGNIPTALRNAGAAATGGEQEPYATPKPPFNLRGTQDALERERARNAGGAPTQALPTNPADFQREVDARATRSKTELNRGREARRASGEPSAKVQLPFEETTKYVNNILSNAGQIDRNLPPERMAELLLPHVIKQESGGNPNAVSPKGARGLMQVMDATNGDPGYGVAPARDNSPAERARVGRDYLTAMLREFRDPVLALAAYNAGPGTVKKWLQAGVVGAAQTGRNPGYSALTSRMDKLLGLS